MPRTPTTACARPTRSWAADRALRRPGLQTRDGRAGREATGPAVRQLPDCVHVGGEHLRPATGLCDTHWTSDRALRHRDLHGRLCRPATWICRAAASCWMPAMPLSQNRSAHGWTTPGRSSCTGAFTALTVSGRWIITYRRRPGRSTLPHCLRLPGCRGPDRLRTHPRGSCHVKPGSPARSRPALSLRWRC
jgi:hypothetical protein